MMRKENPLLHLKGEALLTNLMSMLHYALTIKELMGKAPYMNFNEIRKDSPA